MSAPRSARRLIVEVRPTIGEAGRRLEVGGRPLQAFWPFLGPHFHDVLLPPLRRFGDDAVKWSWTDPLTSRPPPSEEAAAIRSRLTGGAQALQDAADDLPADPDPTARDRRLLIRELAQQMGRICSRLAALPEAELTRYVAHTANGPRLHSWGFSSPGDVRAVDAEEIPPHDETTAAQPPRRHRWFRRIGGAILLLLLLAAVFVAVRRMGKPTASAAAIPTATAAAEPATASELRGKRTPNEAPSPQFTTRTGASAATVNPALPPLDRTLAPGGTRITGRVDETFAGRDAVPRPAASAATAGTSLAGGAAGRSAGGAQPSAGASGPVGGGDATSPSAGTAGPDGTPSSMADTTSHISEGIGASSAESPASSSGGTAAGDPDPAPVPPARTRAPQPDDPSAVLTAAPPPVDEREMPVEMTPVPRPTEADASPEETAAEPSGTERSPDIGESLEPTPPVASSKPTATHSVPIAAGASATAAPHHRATPAVAPGGHVGSERSRWERRLTWRVTSLAPLRLRPVIIATSPQPVSPQNLAAAAPSQAHAVPLAPPAWTQQTRVVMKLRLTWTRLDGGPLHLTWNTATSPDEARLAAHSAKSWDLTWHPTGKEHAGQLTSEAGDRLAEVTLRADGSGDVCATSAVEVRCWIQLEQTSPLQEATALSAHLLVRRGDGTWASDSLSRRSPAENGFEHELPLSGAFRLIVPDPNGEWAAGADVSLDAEATATPPGAIRSAR